MSDDFTDKYGERKPPQRGLSDRGQQLARLAGIVLALGIGGGIALGLAAGAATDGDLAQLTVVKNLGGSSDGEFAFNWLLCLLVAGPGVVAWAILRSASSIIATLED